MVQKLLPHKGNINLIIERCKMKVYGHRYHGLHWLKGCSKGFLPGFTLIELMISVAILGILLATGVPAVNSYMTRQAPQYAADELYGDIQMARLRAARYKRRSRILFNVPLPNQYTVLDVDNAGNVILPAQGGIVKVVDLAKFRDNITFVNSPRAFDPLPFTTLEFLSQGVVNTAAGATLPATANAIYLTNQANDIYFRIVVSIAGGSAVHRYNLSTNQWITN
jgi:prepilin-type N-terminal cleavage/methylation domain-containing protein